MARRWLGVVVFLVGCCLVFSGAASAQKITDFSALQVTLSPEGKTLHESPIHALGGKLRIENFMPDAEEKLVMIYRPDKKKIVYLNPGRKSFFENEADEAELGRLGASYLKGKKEKDLGEETVSGYACRKKEIETEIEVMGFRKRDRMLVWQSPRFDMPLRTRGEGGETTELRKIQPGKPAASLFEVPAGYARVGSLIELMGEEAPPEPPAKGGKPSSPGFPIELPPGIKIPVPRP
ncbi:MAG: DUF4412 domain-containing protein [Desulfobacterales bacterium]